MGQNVEKTHIINGIWGSQMIYLVDCCGRADCGANRFGNICDVNHAEAGACVDGARQGMPLEQALEVKRFSWCVIIGAVYITRPEDGV